MARETIKYCLAILMTLGVSAATKATSAASPTIDQSHMRAALAYKDRPSRENLSDAAFSEATDIIRRHNILAKRFPPQTSIMDITRLLLDKSFSSEAMEVINARIAAITDDGRRYVNCVAPALDYLPTAMHPKDPVYLTWGYGTDIYLNGQATLDITAMSVTASEDGLWRACIRSYHQLGTSARHRQLFAFNDVSTPTEMLAYLEYRLYIEGTAQYAALQAIAELPAEKKTGVLTLSDFNQLRAQLQSSNQRLSNELRAQAEQFDNSPDAILTIGKEMATFIAEKLGRDRLNDGLLGGPATFMALYDQARRISGSTN